MAGSLSDIARWTNATGNGNFSDSDNWIVEAGTPSTPPTDDEVMLLDYRGNDSPSSGLDFSAVTLGALRVRGYRGNLNGLEVSAATLDYDGQGVCDLDGDFATVNIASTNGGSLVFSGGDIDDFTMQDGQVTIGAAATIARDSGDRVRVLGGVLRVESNANGFAGGLEVSGRGEVWTKRTLAAADVDGGRITTMLAAAGTTINIVGNGVFNHRSSGTLTTVNARRGAYTNAGSVYNATITTLNHNVALAEVVEKSGSATTTVTNRNEYGVEQGVVFAGVGSDSGFGR